MELGLTDYEKKERIARRRELQAMFALPVLLLILLVVGYIEKQL